jgi:Arc/MetJ-type ribon-helix-helix transcriptional regulator
MDYHNIPAATKYGHSVNIGCKVTPELYAEIQTFVQSGRFPFRTNSDLMREAIYTYNRQLAAEDPGLVKPDITDVMMEITKTEARSEQFSQVVSDGLSQVARHLGNENVDDATRLWQKLWTAVGEMEPGETKDVAVDRMQKYGFLRSVEPMSLRPSKAS